VKYGLDSTDVCPFLGMLSWYRILTLKGEWCLLWSADGSVVLVHAGVWSLARDHYLAGEWASGLWYASIRFREYSCLSGRDLFHYFSPKLSSISCFPVYFLRRTSSVEFWLRWSRVVMNTLNFWSSYLLGSKGNAIALRSRV
jgi:hypothetical protein